MRNLKTYLGLLFAGALALTSCQNDFDDPSMTVPTSSWLANESAYDVMTISQLKTAYWEDAENYYKTIGEGADGKHILVKGRVISSDASGNIYKSLVIQDATGALAMSINQNSMCVKYRRGQELVLDVTGMTIGKYASLQQLGSPEDDPTYGAQTTFMPYAIFEEHSQLNGLPDLAALDTITVRSKSDLPTTPEGLRQWQSQLVRFNDVAFENAGVNTFALSKETVNETLNLSDGNTIVVRTSGYSNFWSDPLPTGRGDIVGILSYHTNGGWQILLIDREGCMNFGNPTQNPGGEDNPYTVDDAIAIEAGGGVATQVWTRGYIVGAVAPGVQTVSGNSDIQFTDKPDLDNTLVIASSKDCKDYTQCLVVALPQGSKLRQYGNLVDNPTNYGKTIDLKGNLAEVMGTYGITGNNGTTAEFKIEGVEVPADPGTEAGDGTEEKPYLCSQIIAMNPTSTDASPDGGAGIWMTGYIVGSMPTGGSSTTLSGTKFSIADAAETNIVVGPTPDCTDVTLCVGIQLPGESSAPGIRSSLNLKANPGNLGKAVSLYGDVMKYCGGPGLKNTSKYKLDGGSTPDTPDTPGEVVTSIDEDFNGLSSLPTGWSQKQIEGTKTWYITSFNNIYYASMTGYKGTAPFDSWLISPAVNMDGVNEKVLSFDNQVNGYGSTTSVFETYVMTTGDPSTATLTKLNPTLSVAPASGYSEWTNSGNLDLSSFSGIVYIGFRYKATTDANYATWCVTNVKLGKKSGGETPDEPVTPPSPSGDTSADFSTFGSTNTTYGTYTSTTGWVAAWAQILSGSTTPDNKNTFAVFGTDKDFAVCLNGNTAKIGTLTSPTLGGGLGTLTFDYCQPYTDTKCKLTINIKQNGNVVASDVLENNGMTKLTKYVYSHNFGVSGDFVIEIVNDCPSAATSNKDRVALWNMGWTH